MIIVGNIFKWICDNKEWLFSGLGITIIGLAVAFSKKITITFKRLYKKIKITLHDIKFKNLKENKDFDDSLFISEKPYNGISIPLNKKFKKSWTIKNNGNVIWKGRTLRCVEYAGDCFYPVKDTIKIPTTLPGQIITLTVEYNVTQLGNYRSKWKMYDKDNNLIYPQKSIGLCSM